MLSADALKILEKIDSTVKENVIADIKNMNTETLAEFFSDLQMIHKKLSHRLTDNDKFIIEEYKLAIIQSIENKLQFTENEKNKKSNTKKSILKTIFANIFSFLTPLFSGVSGFLGCKALLALIPSIANPVVLGISIAAGILEGTLSAAIDVMSVRKNLGVSTFNLKPTVCTYRNQLEATQRIHRLLLASRCVNRLNADDYCKYQKIITLFNNDIKEKNTLLTKQHKAGPIRKGIKILVGITESALFAGSGFFMGKCILGLFAVGLLATPVGSVICASAALFSLGSFYYLRKKTLSQAVDKISGDPKQLRKLQHHFIHGKRGIKYFDQEIKSIIFSKQKKEIGIKTLATKLKKLEKQNEAIKTRPMLEARLQHSTSDASRKHLRFFSNPNKEKNSSETHRSDKSSFCSTLTRRKKISVT